MSLNYGLRKKILLSIVIFILLNSVSYQIKIPIKKIKTKFQKSIKKNGGGTITIPKISDEFNTLENYLFAADLTIGSNKQKFTILLDTGSQILWVPGEQATSSSPVNVYRPSSSSTSQRTSEKLNYEYAQGTITGYYYNDQINFLLPNSFYINFGVADQTNLLEYFFDGIMGLARQSDSKYSVLHAIKNVGGISSIKFSFKYDYDTDELFFYLGEEHEDFKNVNSGILASCPLINSDHYGKKLWVCDIFSLYIKKGDDTVVKKITFNSEALFDTGTNNIVFPSKYISDLQSTFSSLNCFLYEEGNSNVGSQKALYCRDPNNLPKIAIGLKEYVLTLGKSNFYNTLNINNEIVYRLRFLFVDGISFIIIGQNFYYEYHTLFDDQSGVLKFFSEEKTKIVYHEEDSSSSKTWLIVLLIVGGIIILSVATALIIYYCWYKPKKYYKNIVLNKELMEMSSIKKEDDVDDENEETNFNQIMSITSNKKSKGININIHTKV